ncbi:Uncharacterized protein GBIM_16200 [Gryllus bimaculatus]|nr:Uncharacterized protein GBIM_16200 [Gryllus bimaculatus]
MPNESAVSFDSEPEIQRHVASHVLAEGASLECRLCRRVLASPLKLQAHLIEHTFAGCGAFTCYLCSAVFTAAAGLQSHMLQHGLHARPYDCSRCALRFFFRAELEHHSYSHLERDAQQAAAAAAAAADLAGKLVSSVAIPITCRNPKCAAAEERPFLSPISARSSVLIVWLCLNDIKLVYDSSRTSRWAYYAATAAAANSSRNQKKKKKKTNSNTRRTGGTTLDGLVLEDGGAPSPPGGPGEGAGRAGREDSRAGRLSCTECGKLCAHPRALPPTQQAPHAPGPCPPPPPPARARQGGARVFGRGGRRRKGATADQPPRPRRPRPPDAARWSARRRRGAPPASAPPPRRPPTRRPRAPPRPRPRRPPVRARNESSGGFIAAAPAASPAPRQPPLAPVPAPTPHTTRQVKEDDEVEGRRDDMPGQRTHFMLALSTPAWRMPCERYPFQMGFATMKDMANR